MNTFTNYEDIANHIAKKREDEIVNQLNEHISRGLIEIEHTPQHFVSDPFVPGKIEIRTGVRLKLKEQQYIESLEKKIEAIKQHMKLPNKDLNWIYYLENEIMNDTQIKENKLKKLVSVEEVDGEGLLGLLGQQVDVFCMNYIYAGILSGVNDEYIKLDNAHIVYSTGDFKSPTYNDAQKISDSFYVQKNSIESFGKSSKKL